MLDIENGNQTDEVESIDIDDDENWDLGEEGLEEGQEESTEEESEEVEEQEESEESEEQTEDDDEEEETEEVEDTTDTELGDLEINVLGEKVKLSDIPRDELKADVQKGKDYDRVKGQRDTFQDNVNEWNEISEMLEMSPKEVKDALKTQVFTKISETEGRNVEDVKKEYEANRRSASEKMYSQFLDKYPDMKVDDLPQDVQDSVKSGENLLSAYEKHVSGTESAAKDSKISELEAKLAKLESKEKVKTQNTKTKKKAVVKKTKGDNIDHDDFLDGFLD